MIFDNVSIAEVSPAVPVVEISEKRPKLRDNSGMFGDRYARNLAPHVNIKSGAKRSRGAPEADQSQPPTLRSNTGSGDQSSEQSCSEPTDPAFRVKMMECVQNGWPDVSLISDVLMPSSKNEEKSFASFLELKRQEVLEWVYKKSGGEIWSLKRQGLLILSAVISRWENVPELELRKAVDFICESYLANSMHNQVREGSLVSLRRILEDSIGSLTFEVLRGPLSHDIRILLLRAQNDSSPGVLDELQRIRAVWKGRDSSF